MLHRPGCLFTDADIEITHAFMYNTSYVRVGVYGFKHVYILRRRAFLHVPVTSAPAYFIYLTHITPLVR